MMSKNEKEQDLERQSRLDKKGRGAASTKTLTQHQGEPPSEKCVKKINSIRVKKSKLFDER